MNAAYIVAIIALALALLLADLIFAGIGVELQYT